MLEASEGHLEVGRLCCRSSDQIHLVWAGVGSCGQSIGRTLYPVDGGLQLAAHQDGVAAGCRSFCSCCSGRRGCRSRCRVCRSWRWGPALRSLTSGLMATIIAPSLGTPHHRCAYRARHTSKMQCRAAAPANRAGILHTSQTAIHMQQAYASEQRKAWGSANPSAGVAASGGAEAAAAGAELIAATACT